MSERRAGALRYFCAFSVILLWSGSAKTTTTTTAAAQQQFATNYFPTLGNVCVVLLVYHSHKVLLFLSLCTCCCCWYDRTSLYRRMMTPLFQSLDRILYKSNYIRIYVVFFFFPKHTKINLMGQKNTRTFHPFIFFFGSLLSFQLHSRFLKNEVVKVNFLTAFKYIQCVVTPAAI